jgi:hypothetical protein
VPWVRLRSIVEESAAKRAADSFMERLHRFEEAWDALKWLLSRNPYIGTAQLGDDGEQTGYWLYVQATDIFAKTPELWIVYSFTVNP